MRHDEVRRQVRHARRCLRLPVHDDEVPPVLRADLGVALHLGGRQPSAGLRHQPQARQGGGDHVEAHPVEQVEGVGYPGDGGHLCAADEIPEAPVHDRQVAQHEPGAGGEVAVEHGEAVAVVHRE